MALATTGALNKHELAGRRTLSLSTGDVTDSQYSRQAEGDVPYDGIRKIPNLNQL